MKNWAFSLFIFLSLNSIAATTVASGLTSGPESAPGSSSQIEQVASITEAVRRIIPPGRYQCSYDKILQMVQPRAYDGHEVSFGNVGLNRHFNQIMQANKCFSQRAYTFWTDIGKISAPLRNGESHSRPSLSERAGEGRFSEFPAGWLFDRALRATNGDRNAAVTLAAMCTHDDINMSMASTPPEPLNEEFKQGFRTQLEVLNATIRQLIESRQGLEPASHQWRLVEHELQGRYRSRARLEDAIKRGRTVVNFTCPSATSPVFSQGSLGRDVEIPDSLRQKILEVQRAPGDRRELASKSYHFSGGAYLGCQLAECGITPDRASQIAGVIANAYRALRICPDIKLNLDLMAELAKTAGIDASANQVEDRLVEAFEQKRSDTNFYDKHVGPWDLYDATSTRAHIRKELAKNDAAILYSKWYFGGPNSLLPGTPCTSIRLNGPSNLIEPEPTRPVPARPMGIRANVSSCGVPGWNGERCQTARRKLASWDVDYEWTAAQHRIGAKFGAEQCKPRPANTNWDQAMCETSPGTPSAPSAAPTLPGAR